MNHILFCSYFEFILHKNQLVYCREAILLTPGKKSKARWQQLQKGRNIKNALRRLRIPRETLNVREKASQRSPI